MSIRWHFMSRRPSSNTENRPIGPAPTIATSVERTSLIDLPLLSRRRHDEAVELLADLDLAGEPRIRPHLEGEVEHVLFHLRGLADLLRPLRRDIDVAGGAGAGAAAFGFDARNGVAQRGFHHRGADLRLDRAGLP